MDAALAMLERSVTTGRALSQWQSLIEEEPAFAPLRQDKRFQDLTRRIRAGIEEQKRELERLRQEGAIPARG